MQIKKSKFLLEPHYFPCIRYISKLYLFDEVIIDDDGHFEKQSYRNRCHIGGANGLVTLTVPVHDSRKEIAIRDVKIDHHISWERQHWQSIRSAYGKSPYFEHYAEKIEGLLKKKYNFLF